MGINPPRTSRKSAVVFQARTDVVAFESKDDVPPQPTNHRFPAPSPGPNPRPLGARVAARPKAPAKKR